MESNNIYKKLFEIKKSWIKLQRDTSAFNYKYATLGQIQEKLNWEFEKQWLLVIHYIENNNVVTTICDTDSDSKEHVRSEIPMTQWTKPQDKWSEITYYRRYNLLSLLDLEVEDDDGAKAQWVKKTTQTKEYVKLDALDYVTRIKDEKDVNYLDVIYKEFMTLSPSDKQKSWLIKECAERKAFLLNNK